MKNNRQLANLKKTQKTQNKTHKKKEKKKEKINAWQVPCLFKPVALNAFYLKAG